MKTKRGLGRMFALLLAPAISLSAAAQEGKRIIVAVSPVKQINVTQSSTGVGGAATGALAAGEMSDKTQQLTKKAQELGVPDIGAMIATRLEKELTQKGYTIVHETSSMPTQPENVDTPEPPTAIARPDADLILMVIFILPGFNAANMMTPYHPNLRATVWLRSAKTRKILQTTRLVYGETFLGARYTKLPYDAKYSYANFDTLVAKAPEAFEGLQKGVDPMVAAIMQTIPVPGAAR